jgi:hypothetical protein
MYRKRAGHRGCPSPGQWEVLYIDYMFVFAVSLTVMNTSEGRLRQLQLTSE